MRHPLLAAGLVLIAAAGCLTLPGEAEPPGTQNATASPLELPHLDAETLTQDRVTVDQETAGWQSARLEIPQDAWSGSWGSDGGTLYLNLTHAIELDTAPHATLGTAFHAELPNQNASIGLLPFFTLDDDAPPLVIQVQHSCSGACPETPPEIDLAFVTGTPEGRATLSIGVQDEQPLDGPDPALFPDGSSLLERDPVPALPEHEGRTLIGGTHALLDAGPEQDPVAWTAGTIHANHDPLAPPTGGVHPATHHTMGADAELPETGTTSALMAALDAASTSEWTIGWSIGDAQGEELGAHATVGDETQGFPPVFSAMQETPPGQATFSLERTVTGTPNPTLPETEPLPTGERIELATWGFLDTTLEELYGWTLTEHADAASPLETPAQEGVSTTVRACPLPAACIEQPLDGSLPILRAG